ncbi:MAG: hypothetical protein WBD40_07375 [Tepidisphaeraceae bacterium]
MNQDPIVAEVRAARAALMKECDYDLDRLLHLMQQYQKEHPDRLITKEQLDARRLPSLAP